MSEFNFDFGDGLVPAHHHPKGGGIVADSAMVDETVYVGPYAMIYGNARVYGEAKIDGYARIYEDAFVYENVKISGDARVYGKSAINGNARISGSAKVYDKAKIMDQAQVFGEAEVYGNAIVRNSAEVYEDARVYGGADISEHEKVYATCVCTKKPLTVSGLLPSTVTFTDHHITVGCIVLPPSLWKSKGLILIRSFGHSKELSKKWLNSLLSVLDFYDCTDREEDLKEIDEKDLIRRILSGDTQDRIIARRKVHGTQN
jgi:carbonic anhydrase/acetyltransferase-like protein (isoleucine patch superfamily)